MTARAFAGRSPSPPHPRSRRETLAYSTSPAVFREPDPAGLGRSQVRLTWRGAPASAGSGPELVAVCKGVEPLAAQSSRRRCSLQGHPTLGWGSEPWGMGRAEPLETR